MNASAILPASLALLLAAVPLRAATTLLDDTFSNPAETSHLPGQNLPSYANWYQAAGSTHLNVDTTNHALDVDANTITTVNFGSQALGINDSLSASLTFSLATIANVAQDFRVMLFNSAGNPVSADNLGTANSAYQAYTGYGAFFDPAGTPTSGSGNLLQKKTVAATKTDLMANGVESALGSTPFSVTSLIANQTYTLTLTVTRSTATSDRVAISIVNGSGTTIASTSYTDGSATVTSLDSLSFLSTSSAMTLDEAKVTYLAAPEPSEMALVGLGMSALAAFGWRRRVTARI